MAGIDMSFGGQEFPRALEVRQYLYNNAILGQTTRLRTLDRLDAFYKGLEYAHHQTGWDGFSADQLETISPDATKPLGFTKPADKTMVGQKRPTAPLRLTGTVVDRFTGLLFSKKRLPKVTIEDDQESNDFVQAVFKKTRFWRTMYNSRTYGGSMGSSLITVQLRNGRFSFKAHSPKTIQDIVWEDPDLKIPAGVLIQYIYYVEKDEVDPKTGAPTGTMKNCPYLYRRIIDAECDVIFKPAEIVNNKLPEMEIDEHQSYQHRLGEFPGVWIQNLPCEEEIDGVADCEGVYQIFDTIDRQLAQSNKGLLANQDPTVVLSIDKKLMSAGVPIHKGSENSLNVGMGGSANYLEISASGITAAREFVKDLKQAAMDRAQVVLADPQTMAGSAQSALAIEFLYQPMLEKADRLREQYGQAIEVLVDLLLKLGRIWSDPLRYEGNAKPKFDLPPKIVEMDSDPENPEAEMGVQKLKVFPVPGEGSQVALSWGPYFSPTPTDVQTQIGVVATAYGAGLIDLDTAVSKVAHILDIEDEEGLLRRVKEESKKRKADVMANLEEAGMGWPTSPIPRPEGEELI